MRHFEKRLYIFVLNATGVKILSRLYYIICCALIVFTERNKRILTYNAQGKKKRFSLIKILTVKLKIKIQLKTKKCERRNKCQIPLALLGCFKENESVGISGTGIPRGRGMNNCMRRATGYIWGGVNLSE